MGQGSDAAVSLAALIATQRAEHGIPVTVACRALGVSQA
jgi:putative transposase